MQNKLSENQIRNIQPLANLTALTEVSLSKNQISNVAPLETLTALTVLELTGNTIADLAPLRRLKAENPAIAIDIDITEDTQQRPSRTRGTLDTRGNRTLPELPQPLQPGDMDPLSIGRSNRCNVDHLRYQRERSTAIGVRASTCGSSIGVEDAQHIGTAETKSAKKSPPDSISTHSPPASSTQPEKC